MMAAPVRHTGLAPSQISSATMGPISSLVKGQATPKQWRGLVKTAHGRGFTVESFLDATVPDALKQRTQKSIQKQAKQQTSDLYKPVEQQLTQRQQQINQLDTKRKSDLAYYQKWLTDKQGVLNSAAHMADQSLRDSVTQGITATGQAYGVAQQQLLQQNSATNANVSNPALSTGQKQLNQAGQNAIAGQNAAGKQIDDTIAAHIDSRVRMDTNAVAFIASLDSKRMADTWSSLMDLADKRTTLTADKAKSYVSGVMDLNATELSKADKNRSADQFQQTLTSRDKNAKWSRAATKAGQRSSAATATANRDAANARWANTVNKFGITNGAFRDMSPAQQDAAIKSYRKAGGKTKKGRDPQVLFDHGVSLITGSVQSDGKTPYTQDYVKKHRDLIISRIMNKTATTKQQISHELATRAVDAFIYHGRGALGRDFRTAANPTPPTFIDPVTR